MVECFKNDQVPADILLHLCGYMRLGDEKRKNDLAIDQSYSRAADCLLQLIQRRVTEYVRRETALRGVERNAPQPPPCSDNNDASK